MSAIPPDANPNAPVAPIYDKTPLALLLDAAVQKTYHELYTMAELYVMIRENELHVFSLLLFSMHNKTSMERYGDLIGDER